MPIYSSNIVKMTTRRTFDRMFAPVSYTQTYTYLQSNPAVVTRNSNNTSITVYSGVQPTAQDVETNWTSYNQNSLSCLAHYSSGPAWLYNESTMTYYFTNTSNTLTTTALNSGTASWAIIWNTNNVNINTDILPGFGRFIVVPVTLNTSLGIIRYTNLTATTGQAFVPYDGGLSITEA